MRQVIDLVPKLLEKPWGRVGLPRRLVGECDKAIGEIWFAPPAPLDSILTKYLFTSAKLSVQVHPRCAQSPTGRGKDECWLILEAEPGARLATGLREDIEPEELRQSALRGTIEDLLDWREVKADDFLYVPAGTVHAMGPGLTLVEVQQNTDITYRLYDYGRDRPLHLDEAVGNAIGTSHPAELRTSTDPQRSQMLVRGPYFSVLHTAATPPDELLSQMEGPVQLVPLAGACAVDGSTVSAGASAMVEDVRTVDFSSCQRCLVIGLPISS